MANTLHMTDHAPHEAGKALHLLDRKEMAYTPFDRPLSFQCQNSLMINIDDSTGGSDVGM